MKCPTCKTPVTCLQEHLEAQRELAKNLPGQIKALNAVVAQLTDLILGTGVVAALVGGGTEALRPGGGDVGIVIALPPWISSGRTVVVSGSSTTFDVVPNRQTVPVGTMMS